MSISVVKTILDKNYAQLKEYCDKIVADKIIERVNEKKIEVLAKINGKSVEEMLTVMESASVKKDTE